MTHELKDKRILFFAPAFFGYEKVIKSKLSLMCKECVFFDERPSSSTFDKIFIRLNLRFLIMRKIQNYYQSVIDAYNDNYFDYVIFFNPETVTEILLDNLKQKHNKAKFILYMWDSFQNKPHTKELLPYFDSALTFNKEDSVKYNMVFRPLFYIDEYNADVVENKSEKDIDICFIGTVHSDRYKILKEIEAKAKNDNLKIFYYLFFPSTILFIKYKLQTLGKIKIKKSDFSFTPINADQIQSIINRSNVVVDIQHPKQTGLTMRTIEMLGLKKKIMTTNHDIQNYDFYDKKNIYMIDRKKIDIDIDFIKSKYNDANDAVRQKYSINNFLEDIILM